MHRAVGVLLLFILSLTTASAFGCPEAAPGGVKIEFACPFEACPHGASVQMYVLGIAPPAGRPYEPPYEIQSCDELTWDFGDGSPQVVRIGQPSVTHHWTAPGNYVVTVTVRNEKGSVSVRRSGVIASTVARIGMKEARVVETAPSATLTFVRTGETGRRVSATFRTDVDPYGASPVLHAGSTEVVFESGEVEKTIELPLYDNQLYDCERLANMNWAGAAGGAVLTGYRPALWIEDDEPRPTILAGDVSVEEGDRGRTRVTIPVHLSGPLGTYINLYGALHDGTARAPEDYHWDTEGTQIRAGDLTGVVEFDVLGDTQAELDERLTFSIGPYGGLPSSPARGPAATITILNDDAALTPRRQSGLLGEVLPLTLYPGGHSAQPRTVVVRSSDPSAVAVPLTLTIPAGADVVPFEASLLGEALATIDVDLGERIATAHVDAAARRIVVADPHALRIAEGAVASVTVSLVPPRDTPLTVTLTGNPDTIAMPDSVTIPAGGEAAFEVRGVSAGGASIGITSPANGLIGTAVMVDVTPPGKRRRAVR
jgi:PKD repeat protein